MSLPDHDRLVDQFHVMFSGENTTKHCEIVQEAGCARGIITGLDVALQQTNAKLQHAERDNDDNAVRALTAVRDALVKEKAKYQIVYDVTYAPKLEAIFMITRGNDRRTEERIEAIKEKRRKGQPV